MTPAELLERVLAKGPSEELDAHILCALAAPEGSVVEQSRFNGAWCIYTARGRLWEKRGWHRPEGWALTASLDAAVALVERVKPGWAVQMTRQGDGEGAARLWPQNYTGEQYCATCATPALALIAALLRSLTQ